MKNEIFGILYVVGAVIASLVVTVLFCRYRLANRKKSFFSTAIVCTTAANAMLYFAMALVGQIYVIGFLSARNKNMRHLLIFFLAFAGFHVSAQTNTNWLRLNEERDLLARISVISSSDFWVNSNGVLYLQPKTVDRVKILDANKLAKSAYLFLTNSTLRRDFIADIVKDSGADEKYQNAILFPKRLGADYYRLATYKMMQSFENGDALIQDSDDDIYFVSNIGRAADDKHYSNAEMIRTGLKTYTTAIGGTKTVKAYLSIELTAEDEEAFVKIRSVLRKRVSQLTMEMELLKLSQKEAASKK